MKKQINEMFAQINEYKNYLRKTDYQVIKEAELGYEMSDAVRVARQDARDEINRLEYNISVLEEELRGLEDAQAEELEP